MVSLKQEYADTGYPPMDQEHRSISVLLAAVDTASGSGGYQAAKEALVAAETALKAHFKHEEDLMAKHAYPNRERHKQAHDSYLVDVARSRDQLDKQRKVSSEFRRWASGRLLEWFAHHVMVNDVELGRFLAAGQGGAVPPRSARSP
jgi:hemerythrin-like metal-binding protein